MVRKGAASNWIGAALEVLAHAQRPMSASEIADEAIRRGFIETHGKTPALSVQAKLYLYARDNPGGRLVKVSQPGAGGRARRFSVRWALRNNAASQGGGTAQ